MMRPIALLLLLHAPVDAVPAFCPITLPQELGAGGVELVQMDDRCCNEMAAMPIRSQCDYLIKDDLVDHMQTYCHMLNKTGVSTTVCNYDLSEADPSKCVEDTMDMCTSMEGMIVWTNFTIQCTGESGNVVTESFNKPACLGASCSQEDIEAFMWAASPDYASCSFIEINGKSRTEVQPQSTNLQVKRGRKRLFFMLAFVGVGVAYAVHWWVDARKHRDQTLELTEESALTTVDREIT